jgi:crotonobetainyl-CoA:carnitine CoA-transferase CaiB-like acyl-CoA transferase
MASVRADGTPLPRPQLDGMQLGLHPLYRLYETADGWLCLAAIKDSHWRNLLDALEQHPWGADTRFVDAPARTAHADELRELLSPVFKARTSLELFAVLDDHGVPCEIADPDFPRHVFDDPEMQAHGLVVQQQHPKLGSFEHFGTTIHFSETPGRIWGPPPVVGQHTREIMREYEFDDSEIDKLIDAKAVFEELWVD